MPIVYVCRKCRRIYSKAEYAQSRVCIVCGFFLLPTFTKEDLAAPVVQGESLWEKERKERLALFRAAEGLRQRVGQAKEYEVVSEEESVQGSSVFEGWLWRSEFEEALRFERVLLERYRGLSFEEVLPGRVVFNEQGQCYELSSSCFADFNVVPFEECRRVLISDLKVLSGIGPVGELLLKRQGYVTVEDLRHHPRWRVQACDYMRLVDEGEVGSVQRWLGQRFSMSNPLLHYLAGFCSDQGFAIVDIETLGLSERPIILLGIAKPEKGRVCVTQFLLRDISEEASALWALVSRLKSGVALITYNGRCFDVPYIGQRLAYYGLEGHSLDNLNFDLLPFTRRALRSKLANCKLKTVEKYLGISRGVDVPGALVPHFYDTYVRTKNVGPLVPIVEHNRQDLLTLGVLFSKLYEEWHL